MKTSLHLVAARLTDEGRRCEMGCAGCPMAEARDERHNCLIQQFAKTENPEEQIAALCEWECDNPFWPPLKPCPFCDGEAELIEKREMRGYTVRCTNPHCPAHYNESTNFAMPLAAYAWNERLSYVLAQASDRSKKEGQEMTNIQLAARTSCARKGTATREVYELLNAYVAEHDVTIVHMSDILRSYIDDMSKATATPVRFYDEAAASEARQASGR